MFMVIPNCIVHAKIVAPINNGYIILPLLSQFPHKPTPPTYITRDFPLVCVTYKILGKPLVMSTDRLLIE